MKAKQIFTTAILQIAIGIVLFLVSIVLQIDFMIGLIDSLVVALMIFGIIIGSIIFFIKAIFSKNLKRATLSAIVCGSVLIGTSIGMDILKTQFESAKQYIENLANEIHAIKEREGAYPNDLSGVSSYDSSGEVPIGCLRKRPLYYFVNESKDGFRMGFPFSVWMIAK